MGDSPVSIGTRLQARLYAVHIRDHLDRKLLRINLHNLAVNFYIALFGTERLELDNYKSTLTPRPDCHQPSNGSRITAL